MSKDLAKQLLKKYLENGDLLATAESCTGGKLAANITSISGSSNIFDRGFVTYSNQAKIDLLQVKNTTLQQFGAVSKETAQEMVAGTLKNSQANVAIAITGIAGPNSDSSLKPVGLVYIAVQKTAKPPIIKEYHLVGSRLKIQKQTVELALALLLTI